MAVVIETTIGDFTVDLFVDSRPQACKNFLKLCKLKYYNFCLFHSVQSNFLAQTGDPTGVGTGGESIYGVLYGENARYFEAEVMPKLRHTKPGLLSMVNCGNNMLGSQFFITLGDELVSLDGEHCVFGEISEGIDIVLKFNEAICDTLHRPYKDIRITHTIVLEDPFEDPSGLIIPDMSPEATQERLAGGRIGADEEVDPAAGLTAAQVEELRQEREARARATILEIVGDLPDAEMAPPENVLFVCKLNPVTSDDDLEIIFSRFGKVKSCEVIRDKNTGDSLQYAFVEFEDQKSCEEAYFKMDNVLIDDRRIHVDFSQSVAKMRWRGKGRIEYFDNKDQPKDVKSSSHRDREREDSRTRSSRREREYEEREKRRDRGRDREDDRMVRERGRDREGEDNRHRRRDDRDRSRSDWRKRDSKHREEDKRYDSKRREGDSSKKRDDDSKSGSSRSRKAEEKKDEKRSDDKRLDERRRERDINGRSSSRQAEIDKNGSLEKIDVRRSMEKLELKEKEKEKNSKYISPVPNVMKDDTLSDSFNDSQEIPSVSEILEKSPHHSVSINNITADINVEEKVKHVSRRSSKEERHEEKAKPEEIENSIENNEITDEKMSQKSDKTKTKKLEDKTKVLKRKRKVSENRKRKKKRHSSSSESSSESSDSSESSSSSDSSDYRHGKKKKLIVAKRYYKGGKLVKEIKKKKRTKETSDSESLSEDSSDSDPKRKRKSKKHKKVINIFKQPKRKSVQSSDDESQTESSSSEDSDPRGKKKKKRKIVDKHSKKKVKSSLSKKKRKQKQETSSSSDSDDSVRNKSLTKKTKKMGNTIPA